MKRKFFVKNFVLFMAPTVIALIILGSFSINITESFIRNDIDTSNLKMLGQTKETVELIFNELDSLGVSFELDPTVIIKIKDLLEGDLNNYELVNTLDSIMTLINSPVNSKPYIQSLYVYYKNSNQNLFVSNSGIVSLDSFIDTSWYDSFMNHTDNSDIWLETRSSKMYGFENESTRLITVYKRLYSPGSVKADGVIVMNIKRDYIENILKTLVSYRDQNIFILNKDNAIVAGTADSLDSNVVEMSSGASNTFDLRSANNIYKTSQIESGRYQLKYLSMIPESSLYKVPIELVYITVLLLLVSLLLGVAIAYYITKRNYSNINRIISALESAERGEPLPQLPSRIKDEYSYILQSIIKTFLEQSYLKVQLSEKKYKLKAIELLALQSQMNPHFLFNTLKTIFWKSIALTGDQNEVSRMIEHLSSVLHYSLGKPGKEVPLSEEIRNTQSYIEIQQVRYKNKFRVIWQYDEALAHYKVLKLILQPFVENCIYHGIKEKDGFSYIRIKIDRIQSKLRISIIDTGLGIDRKNLNNIRIKLSGDEEFSEHIGIFNTNKRLRLMYGDQYGIVIRSRFGLGTVVYLTIPIEEEKPEMPLSGRSQVIGD